MLGSILSAGLSASPVGAAVGIAGVGLEALGAYKGYEAAKGYQSDVNKYASTVNPLYAAKSAEDMRQVRDQQNIQALNQQYMETTNQRSQLENIRKAQSMRAMSANSAAGSGTQFGSGFAGAQAGNRAQEANNALGLAQGLELGRNIFAQNTDISNSRISEFGIETGINQASLSLQTAEAAYKTNQSEAQGYSSLGGSLVGASGLAMKLFS